MKCSLWTPHEDRRQEATIFVAVVAADHADFDAAVAAVVLARLFFAWHAC